MYFLMSYDICLSLSDLLHFEWQSPGPSMLLQMALFPSFWWLSTIPLYMCHIFFIHSSVSGHSGCLHVLATTNSTAVTTGVCAYFRKKFFWFQKSFFPDICPGVGLLLDIYLDHMVALFLLFWGTSTLFSTVAAPIYIPTNSVGGFPFLHTLSSIHYLHTFWLRPLRLVWGDTSL